MYLGSSSHYFFFVKHANCSAILSFSNETTQPHSQGLYLAVHFSGSYFELLYIKLTISFLIGRKRTANFRNQRLGCYQAADYTLIMSRTLKVTGNHVMYDHGAWFLRVIMSSSRVLCCLPSVKKQKHDFQVCFVDLARHRKSSWRQGLTNTKRSTKGGKGAGCWLREREKTERAWGKERVGTNFENVQVKARKKGFVQCIIKQFIRFGFCDIQNNQGLD